jgi:hypothetical protein
MLKPFDTGIRSRLCRNISSQKKKFGNTKKASENDIAQPWKSSKWLFDLNICFTEQSV